MIRSIRDRWHPVKCGTWRYRRPRQDMSLQLFTARVNIFTLRPDGGELLSPLRNQPRAWSNLLRI